MLKAQNCVSSNAYRKEREVKAMKDKLVKFNHKAMYYRMRSFGIAFVFLFAFSLSVVLPVSVTIMDAVKANEEKSAEVVDDETMLKSFVTLDSVE